MLKIFRFIKNLAQLKAKFSVEAERQKTEGYSIEISHFGSERYVTYQEGKREASIQANFTILNDVILYTDSFRKWEVPRGVELTSFDFPGSPEPANSIF